MRYIWSANLRARIATVVRAHWLVMAALDYGKWDDLYDSDEERQKDKRAEEAKRKADLRKAQLNPQPQQIPGGMTEEQFAAQYAKMFKQPATQQKEPYKFPETMEEQRAKCDEANELKRRGWPRSTYRFNCGCIVNWCMGLRGSTHDLA